MKNNENNDFDQLDPKNPIGQNKKLLKKLRNLQIENESNQNK